jgi:hypothetical protein
MKQLVIDGVIRSRGDGKGRREREKCKRSFEDVVWGCNAVWTCREILMRRKKTLS